MNAPFFLKLGFEYAISQTSGGVTAAEWADARWADARGAEAVELSAILCTVYRGSRGFGCPTDGADTDATIEVRLELLEIVTTSVLGSLVAGIWVVGLWCVFGPQRSSDRALSNLDGLGVFRRIDVAVRQQGLLELRNRESSTL
jgi:hypothetical protein